MNDLLLTILLAATELGGANVFMWTTLLLTPISAIIGWIAGKRRRNNETLEMLQKTVDMLVKKNSELYAKITEQNKMICNLNEQNSELNTQLVEVRRENGELKEGQDRMGKQLTSLQAENTELRKELKQIKGIYRK